MTKTRDLNGPSLEAINETKFLIIFLHGWGSNGDDLIQIGYQWHEILNNITFLAPNGPDACPENPLGRQWFDILSNDENNMLDGLEHVNLYGYKSLKNLCDRSSFDLINYETVISEIGVVNNYLDFTDPYLGKTKNTDNLFDLIDENLMHKAKLGYKFQACLKVK